MRLKKPVVIGGVLIVVAVIAAVWTTGEDSGETESARADAMGLTESATTAAPATSSREATTAAAPTTTTSPATATGVVVRVIDGDTIEVRLGAQTEVVRLIGINSPERDECFSAESRAFLERLLGDESVRLQRDQSNRDQYDRLLRYVYLNDVFVNQRSVAQGMSISRSYPPDTRHQEQLRTAQQRAQENQAGLWAPTACGGAGTDDFSLEVTEVNHNPPGDETEDLNAEYIVITNTGQTLDLAGWLVRDESSTNRFTFPSGFTLDAGGSVTIHSGCGEPSATDLYWCSERNAVWNNSGDTVFIQTPSGQTVTSRSYEE